MAATKRKTEDTDHKSGQPAKKKRAAEFATAAVDRPRRGAVPAPKPESERKKEPKRKTVEGKLPRVKAEKNKIEKAEQVKGTKTKTKAVEQKAAKPEPKPARKSSKETPAKTKTASTKAKANETPKDDSKAKPKASSKATPALSGHERGPDEVCYWLMKAEPESRVEKGVDVKFSIDDLKARKEPEPWDGVRNPMAQKNMRTMRKGDLAFFYHSNCKVPGIAGIMRIVREHSVDESAFDPAHPYYDEKSSRDKPRWSVVHVEHVRTLDELIPLKELQKHAVPGQPLNGMQVLKMSRLSVSRVTPDEWEFVLRELVGLDPKDVVSKK